MKANRRPPTIFRDVREVSAVVPGTAPKSKRRIGRRLIRAVMAYLARWISYAGSKKNPSVDAFQFLTLICIATIPFVFLLRNVAIKSGGPPVH